MLTGNRTTLRSRKKGEGTHGRLTLICPEVSPKLSRRRLVSNSLGRKSDDSEEICPNEEKRIGYDSSGWFYVLLWRWLMGRRLTAASEILSVGRECNFSDAGTPTLSRK